MTSNLQQLGVVFATPPAVIFRSASIFPAWQRGANLLGGLILPMVFGREHGEAENLMNLTGGNSQFIQVMTDDGIDVASKGEMSRTRESHVAVESARSSSAVDVSVIESFAAVMLARGPGHVVDVLAILLVEKGGHTIVPAIRDFKFEPTAELKRHQIRQISVVPKGGACR
jgi:hypothetical protein